MNFQLVLIPKHLFTVFIVSCFADLLLTAQKEKKKMKSTEVKGSAKWIQVLVFKYVIP